MKKSIIKLAKNKYVFYFFVALAIINVLGYFSVKAWECMVLFAAVAYSVNCYANNGTLAILGGLFVSNFVFGCNRVKEGFFEGNAHMNKKDGEDHSGKNHQGKNNNDNTADVQEQVNKALNNLQGGNKDNKDNKQESLNMMESLKNIVSGLQNMKY